VFKIMKAKRKCPFPRLTWEKNQDLYLYSLVDLYGERNWKKVEQEMKAKFPELPINGKKCRERWLNVGKRGIDRGSLTEFEDLMLIVYHHTYSNSWSAIAKRLPNRNPSTLKNNFYSLIKKVARQALLFSKGEHLYVPSPVQFYSSLYIITLLTHLLETKKLDPYSLKKEPINDAVDSAQKYLAPPHIADYVFSLNLTVKVYESYAEELNKVAIFTERYVSKGALDKLKGLKYDGLIMLCHKISELVPQFAFTMDPNQAVCSAIEKVLGVPAPQPQISAFQSTFPMFSNPSSLHYQSKLGMPTSLPMPMASHTMLVPSITQQYVITSLSYASPQPFMFWPKMS